MATSAAYDLGKAVGRAQMFLETLAERGPTTKQWKLRVWYSPLHDGHGGYDEYEYEKLPPSERSVEAKGGLRAGRRVELFEREVTEWKRVD